MAADGRLHRIHRQVYALGHAALSLQGRLWAALLYARPGGRPQPHDSRLDLVADRDRADADPPDRAGPASFIAGCSCSPLPPGRMQSNTEASRDPRGRTLLDLGCVLSAAPTSPRAGRGGLSRPARSRRGRVACSVEGDLVRSRSEAPSDTTCLSSPRPSASSKSGSSTSASGPNLRLPEVNARVGRMRVDALWREERIAVELDGAAAHGGWAAIRRDRQREIALRAARVSGRPIHLGPGDNRPPGGSRTCHRPARSADLGSVSPEPPTADPRPQRSRPAAGRGHGRRTRPRRGPPRPPAGGART